MIDYLFEFNLKNIMAWRGASGSDDLIWIGLSLLNIYSITKNSTFLEMDY